MNLHAALFLSSGNTASSIPTANDGNRFWNLRKTFPILNLISTHNEKVGNRPHPARFSIC